MNRIRHHPAVSTISVVLTLLFYKAFEQFVAPQISVIPGASFVLSILASVGFYVSFFSGLLWLYFRYIEDVVNPKEAICGDWFYKLDVHGRPSPRYGLCYVTRHRGELSASGIHYHPDHKKFTSRFTSDYVLIENHTLIILYTSVGVDEDIFLRRGVFFLATEGVPPSRIYGVWTDLLPTRNSGDIVFQRRDRNTDDLLTTLGYPLTSSELQKVLNAPGVPVASSSPANASGV